jgi:uncharacterized protein
MRRSGRLHQPRSTIYDLPFTIYYSPEVIQYSDDHRGLTFAVRIVPRASRSEIAGEHDGALRVRIAAPPVDGAANRELIKLLAKLLKVPQSAVEIVSGVASKNKIVRIQGGDATELAQALSLK